MVREKYSDRDCGFNRWVCRNVKRCTTRGLRRGRRNIEEGYLVFVFDVFNTRVTFSNNTEVNGDRYPRGNGNQLSVNFKVGLSNEKTRL